MHIKYELIFTKPFAKKLKKLLCKSPHLEKNSKESLQRLIKLPFYPSLRTHKVTTSKYGTAWSSRVTGDLRIIWQFDENKITILLYDIGGHSGNSQVYK